MSTVRGSRMQRLERWDSYFHSVCKAVASNSKCMSRMLGAVLVRDNSIVSTGYNGPPRGIPHCEGSICPRAAQIKSGEGLHLCPAEHAESNCIANAARHGVITLGATLYLNFIIPCKRCFGTLINAGILEIVVEDEIYYDQMSKIISSHSQVKVRTFTHDYKI